MSPLICEGGLPLHLFADDRDPHIKLFFRSLIQRAEQFGGSASRFADGQLTLLPSSFRNEAVQLTWIDGCKADVRIDQGAFRHASRAARYFVRCREST